MAEGIFAVQGSEDKLTENARVRSAQMSTDLLSLYVYNVWLYMGKNNGFA